MPEPLICRCHKDEEADNSCVQNEVRSSTDAERARQAGQKFRKEDRQYGCEGEDEQHNSSYCQVAGIASTTHEGYRNNNNGKNKNYLNDNEHEVT
jgi:hypothetical protein